MTPLVLSPDLEGYPTRLAERLGSTAPDALRMLGAPGLLCRPLLAWFGSAAVPPDLILPAYDLARLLRDRGVGVVSGFHSPIERDVLELLLRGSQPVVACPARGIGRMRVPREWSEAVRSGRMLVLSPFADRVRRPIGGLAEERNRIVAALADRVFIVSAAPGGRLHRLARELAAGGQRLACFDHPANEDLLLLGASGIDPGAPRPPVVRG